MGTFSFISHTTGPSGVQSSSTTGEYGSNVAAKLAARETVAGALPAGVLSRSVIVLDPAFKLIGFFSNPTVIPSSPAPTFKVAQPSIMSVTEDPADARAGQVWIRSDSNELSVKTAVGVLRFAAKGG